MEDGPNRNIFEQFIVVSFKKRKIVGLWICPIEGIKDIIQKEDGILQSIHEEYFIPNTNEVYPHMRESFVGKILKIAVL